jgi:predicted Zn-dependent peptidase
MRSQVFFWSVFLSMIFGLSDIVSAQKVSVEEFTLSNGMQFLLVPRTDQPNVVSAGWVARVGSVNERPGITGISHFFEHMMFKGTNTIGTRNPDKDRTFRVEQKMKRHLKSLNKLTQCIVIAYYRNDFARQFTNSIKQKQLA